MNEYDYINATNLARLRAMQAILLQCSADPEQVGFKVELARALMRWIHTLEPAVSVSPGDQPERTAGATAAGSHPR